KSLTVGADTGDLKRAPGGGQAGRELGDSGVCDIEAAETIEEGLEYAACAGGEIGVSAGGRFGDDAKGWAEVGGVAFFEDGKCFIGHAEAFVEDGEDGVGHGGSFAYAGFVVFEVFADGGGRGDLF